MSVSKPAPARVDLAPAAVDDEDPFWADAPKSVEPVSPAIVSEPVPAPATGTMHSRKRQAKRSSMRGSALLERLARDPAVSHEAPESVEPVSPAFVSEPVPAPASGTMHSRKRRAKRSSMRGSALLERLARDPAVSQVDMGPAPTFGAAVVHARKSRAKLVFAVIVAAVTVGAVLASSGYSSKASEAAAATSHKS
jgi:hypothetical protein